MFIARSDAFDHVFLGSEIQPERRAKDRRIIMEGLSCPLCGIEVEYNPSSRASLIDKFEHKDGSVDCFATDSVSYEHRIAVEVVVKELYNHISQVTGSPIEIDVEKWIGSQPNFIITDIRISSPLKIAAEVFYGASRLELHRRMETIFNNDYRVYLIFHLSGRHDVDRVERYIQQISALELGRFNPNSLTVTLGDLFTENRIKITQLTRERLPDYIV